MNWIIERDKNGWPVRMWWTRRMAPGEGELEKERIALERVNALPMPAMREWAKARGLIQ